MAADPSNALLLITVKVLLKPAAACVKGFSAMDRIADAMICVWNNDTLAKGIIN